MFPSHDQGPQVRGKKLPLGSNSVVACVTGIQLKETANGDPNVHIRTIVVEDEHGTGSTDYQGLYQGFNYWFGESEYNDPVEVYENMLSDLKLMGFVDEVENSDDPEGVVKAVSGAINLKLKKDEKDRDAALNRGKKFFLFDVDARARKNGDLITHVKEPLEDYEFPASDRAEKPSDDVEEAPDDEAVFEEGDKVQVRWEDGEVYAAEVLEVFDDGLRVKFDDDESEQEVDLADVIPFDSDDDEPEADAEEESVDLEIDVDWVGDYNDEEVVVVEVSEEGDKVKVKGENGRTKRSWINVSDIEWQDE